MTNPNLPAPAAPPQLPAILPVICDQCRATGQAGDPAFTAIGDILAFDPVPRRAHVNNWTAEHQRAFIAALAITGSAKKAAATIGRHAFGADQLRKARGGKGFSEAWDAALDVARERELARVYENLSELRASDEAANARAPADPWANDRDWEEVEGEYEEAQKRVRGKLLGARRLLLAEISSDMNKRAAWEVLVGPVDWEKAGSFEPQDNEPEQPNMREADMVLTAEGGWLAEMTGGRDKKKELLEAVEEYAATGREDGPAVRRIFGKE